MHPTKQTHQTGCRHCAVSQKMGRSVCLFCGAAMRIGRLPTPEEISRTNPIDLAARSEQARLHKRTPQQLDAQVLDQLKKHYQPLQEFTNDQFAEKSGLTACALKHSLDRLKTKGVVAAVGTVRIKWNRHRTIWQYLLQPEHVAARSSSASAKSNRQSSAPSHGKRNSISTAASAGKLPAAV